MLRLDIPEVVEHFHLGWLVECYGCVPVGVVLVEGAEVHVIGEVLSSTVVFVQNAESVLDIVAEVDWRLGGDLYLDGKGVLTGSFGVLVARAEAVDVRHCNLVGAHVVDAANLTVEVDRDDDHEDEDQHRIEEGEDRAVNGHALVIDASSDAVERTRSHHLGKQRYGHIFRRRLDFFLFIPFCFPCQKVGGVH